MPNPPLVYTFVDNNGKRATVGLHIREVGTQAAALAQVSHFGAALAAVSSAHLIKATLTQFVSLPDYGPAQPGVNLYARAFLLFRDGDRRGLVTVPAPRGLLFDVAGPYRAVRISRERLQLLGLLAPLEAALAGGALFDGSAFPLTYIVGGGSELVP